MSALSATTASPRSALPEPKPRWRSNFAALVALLFAAVLCRIPVLINAGGVHADAAIIGLQAQHILRGEWSWFIWGTNYQGSVDPLLVALGFAIGGATPLTLMLVPLVGHLLLLGFTFATLRRHLTLALACAATLPVVFTPQAINGVALYAPRQWAITLVIAAIWLLDGAGELRRALPRYALGAALGGFALYLDLFAAQFIPALGLFALACCYDSWPARSIVARRVGSCAAGLACSLVALALSRLAVIASPNSVKGGALSVEQLRRNATLLWEQSLPWLLSYGIYIPGAQLYPDRWQPPIAFALTQIAGAALLIVGIAWGGIAFIRGHGDWRPGEYAARFIARRQPWPAYRLGAFGCLVAATSLVGFLASSSPVDMWATRYLAPIIWAAPFALVPAARSLGTRRFLPALAPYVVAAAVGGWLSCGTYVQGLLPVQDPRGAATEEAQLGAALRSRGVAYAAAQYWLAYRLTFLWNEAPMVVPLDPQNDRYPPYRHAYAEAATIAYLFDTTDPRADAASCEASLRATGGRYERVTVANFTALVWSRGAGVPDAAGCVAATAQQSAPSAKK